MNTRQNIWQERIRYAEVSELLVLDRRALSVFHTDTDLRLKPRKWLAMAERNLVELHRKSMEIEPEKLPNGYKSEMRDFWKNNPELLRGAFTQTLPADGDTMTILYALENYPVLPSGLPARVTLLHGFLAELSILAWDSGIWLSLELVRKQTEWLALLRKDLSAFPINEAMEIITKHMNRYQKKSHHHQELAIQWGREFDGYYREALASGKSEKYARTLARRRFLTEHPLPRTDEELLDCARMPGSSMVSLQKYHRAYLSRQRTLIAQNTIPESSNSL